MLRLVLLKVANMNIPTTDKDKLDRMSQIVSDVYHNCSRDLSLLQELSTLAYFFSGMTVRRARLQYCMGKLTVLKQRAAIEKRWAKTYELVGEFPAEISMARHSGSSGGMANQ